MLVTQEPIFLTAIFFLYFTSPSKPAPLIYNNFIRREVCCDFYNYETYSSLDECNDCDVIKPRSLIHALSTCRDNASCAGILKAPSGEFYFCEPHLFAISRDRCVDPNVTYFLYTRRVNTQDDVTPPENVTSTSEFPLWSSQDVFEVQTVTDTLNLSFPWAGLPESSFTLIPSYPLVNATSPSATTEHTPSGYFYINTSYNVNFNWSTNSGINVATELFSISPTGDSQPKTFVSTPQGNPDPVTSTGQLPVSGAVTLLKILLNGTSDISINTVAPVTGLNGSVSQTREWMSPYQNTYTVIQPAYPNMTYSYDGRYP